jgi:hypothetical protein
MPHYTDEKCSSCGKITSPELMVVKTVNFTERKNRKKIVRSRVVAWLCEGCCAVDPDFTAKAYSGPGHTSAALERVRDGRIVE